MAQLDAMLKALHDRGAQELRLSDGERPVFAFPDGARPVSQSVLNRQQITALLRELADQVEQARLTSGEPTRFDFSTGDGLSFTCETRNGGSGFEAVVRPRAERAAPAAAPPATPAPAAAPPVAVAPGDGPPIDRLLTHLVQAGGSDLHLSSGERPMIRLDGDMKPIDGEQAQDADAVLELLRPIVPERNMRQFEDCRDTDFAYEIPGLARFRVNVFMDRMGPGGVMRTIPSKILTVEDLGLPQAVLDLCHLHKGLVLVTGPTGSGKSTTLAAMVDYINRHRTDHIITIEDPIEFVHPNRSCLVNQREVGVHTDSFKAALRAALREDPDIVLVGEMRDLETIAIAIETAETGHLVFGTLHTTTAASTVDRVIDQFPADRQAQIRTMLSESLKGVLSQTLLKKIGGGRVAALEILIALPSIANLIREGKTFQIPSLMQTGRKHGMVQLNDALIDLVKKKLVEPDEAYGKSVDKSSFAGLLRQAGMRVPLDES